MQRFSFMKCFAIFVSLIFATAISAATPNTKLATPAKPVSDSQITSDVKAKVAVDPAVSSTVVAISTNKGTVLIVGTVNTGDQASRLVELAQSSDGVKDVDTSKLNVSNSTQPLTDALITAKIKGKYLQQKLLTDQDIAAMKVQIETKNGVVYLTGTVENAKEMKNAARIARKTSGVKDILNNLKIANQ